jgi:hypothetical protein
MKAKARIRANTRRLWILYRLTPEEQRQIREYERNHPVYRLLLGKRESTDHNHTTGQVRGIAEWRLNKGLGLIEKAAPDNTAEVLRALALFLEYPPAELALGRKVYGLIGLAKANKKSKLYGPPPGTKA